MEQEAAVGRRKLLPKERTDSTPYSIAQGAMFNILWQIMMQKK